MSSIPEMTRSLLQTYETSITWDDHTWTFAYLAIPERSMLGSLPESVLVPETGAGCVIDDPGAIARVVMNELGLQEERTISIDKVPEAIAAILVSTKTGLPPLDLLGRSLGHDFPSAFEFAIQITNSDVIPFEQSPLEATSIAALLAKGTGSSIGAYVGWVVGHGSPYLLLTVPAGMIICGAAAGLATGLDQGLKDRISQWLCPPRARRVANTRRKA